MDSSLAPSNRKFARPKSTTRKGVRVVCKIRPFTESEKHCSANPSQITISRGDNHSSVILHDQKNGLKNTYILDACYEKDETTSKLFDLEVKPLLEGIFHGVNCCVIACGVQGSGKTQLIQGSMDAPGLAMMAFCEIFSSIEEVGGSMTVSCYEMYNDHIYDLLDHKEQKVQIMEDAEKTIQLKGLSKIPVKSLSDFEKYYFHISNQRNVPQKAENNVTIRSHKGLIMSVTSIDKESNVYLVGKLNFMELAGYEEVRKRTHCKAQLSECIKINKSFYALHKVVSAVNDDATYIPYRETKLTRLLQDFVCRTNDAVLITCLSPSLCPQTFPVISLASKSCQFVNRQRNSSVGGIHTLDKTTMNKGTYQLGSSRKDIKKSISTTNVRFHGHGSRVKKPTPSSCCSKKRKLIDVASPLANNQKLENLCNKEEGAKSNVISSFSTLKMEKSPLVRSAEPSSITKMDVSMPIDHIQQSVDSPLSINMKLSHNLEGCLMENDQLEIDKRSPTLTEHLREMSNRLKIMSARSISMCATKKDGSCSMKFSVDSVEPKTPRFPLSSKLDCNSMLESFATPQEKFKTRSIGLKKSLVDECLDYLNSASKEELKQLKGIGEKRATYILELRDETPKPFKEIDDLKGLGLSSKQIKGMMSKIIEDI